MAQRKELKRLSKSIPLPVRFRSISEDADFVRTQARTLNLPAIANERCGLWYVPPDIRAGTAYFKSTDGHVNEWAFNLRRLNLHIFNIIGSRGGVIIVDSCKKGKRMSDALSKTVPIWCCIMNRLLFPERPDAHNISLDPTYVPETEAGEITDRLEGFLVAAVKLDLDIESHQVMLRKPMKIEWISPDRAQTINDISSHQDAGFNHIYLCMASRIQDPKEDRKAAAYIQGAGDDAEYWARGLSPDTFWQHNAYFLSLNETEIPDAINETGKETSKDVIEAVPLRKAWPYPNILLSDDLAPYTEASLRASLVIHCSEHVLPSLAERHGKRYLPLICRKGKLGARDLRLCLPRLTEAMKSFDEARPILVCAPDKSDVGLAVVVAIACRYGTSNGNVQRQPRETGIDKYYIKRELASIVNQEVISQIPVTSLSRASLLALHEYLIPPPQTVIKSEPEEVKAPAP